MRIGVVGGRLQGLEVVYLAKKAGYQALVIDKSRDVPAAGICDRFVCFAFTRDCFVPDGCLELDLIIPAIEDRDVLLLVEKWARWQQIPLAFDRDAYLITCSKLRSNALFDQLHLSTPSPWPGCGFPVVVKPDQASGSQGVRLYCDAAALHADFPEGRIPDTLVAQQYLEGPQFSIEVVGIPQQHMPLCVTDLHMDPGHDCKQVSAPTRLSPEQVTQLEAMALALAEAIDLKGIMDLEVVLHQKDLKLLEIDARFPSQTPMAVYWATGINMVQLLAEQFVFGHDARNEEMEPGTCWSPYSGQPRDRWVVVEHIQAGPDRIRFLGEHIMGRAGPLRLEPGFFGCQEALTNFAPGRSCWAATLIFCADSQKKLAAARKACYKQICEHIKSAPAEAMPGTKPTSNSNELIRRR